MKEAILIITFLFFSKPCLAKQVYFDFNLPSSLLYPKSEINLHFDYSIKGANDSNFTVIPISSQALIEIYNEQNQVWNRQEDLRSDFPTLKPEMKIRLVSFSGAKTVVCFNIQYSKTSEIFQTPCKTLWNREHFKKYIDAINVKILRWVKRKNSAIGNWLPAFFIMLVIFILSSVTGPVIDTLGLNKQTYQINAHFFLFILLCVGYFKATKNIFHSVMLCVIYAVLDEFHQTFTPFRSSSTFDILVDISGALISGGLIWRFQHILPKKLKNWLLK